MQASMFTPMLLRLLRTVLIAVASASFWGALDLFLGAMNGNYEDPLTRLAVVLLALALWVFGAAMVDWREHIGRARIWQNGAELV